MGSDTLLRAARLSVAFLLLAAGVRAEEPPAPKRATREVVARYLKSRAAAIQLLAKQAVTYQVEEESLKAALEYMKWRYGFDVRMFGTSEVAAQTLRLKFDFKDKPGDEVLAYIALVTDFSVVVDASGKLWLLQPGEEGERAAEGWEEAQAMRDAETEWRVDGRSELDDAGEQRLLKRAAAQRVTIDVAEKPLFDVLRQMGKAADLLVDVDNRDHRSLELLKLKVTFRARDRALPAALDALCEAYGLEWYVGDEMILVWYRGVRDEYRKETEALEARRLGRIDAQEKLFARQVTVHGKNLSIRELAVAVQEETGVPLYVDADAWDSRARWTIPNEKAPLSRLIAGLETAGFDVFYRRGTIWVLRRPE